MTFLLKKVITSTTLFLCGQQVLASEEHHKKLNTLDLEEDDVNHSDSWCPCLCGGNEEDGDDTHHGVKNHDAPDDAFRPSRPAEEDDRLKQDADSHTTPQNNDEHTTGTTKNHEEDNQLFGRKVDSGPKPAIIDRTGKDIAKKPPIGLAKKPVVINDSEHSTTISEPSSEPGASSEPASSEPGASSKADGDKKDDESSNKNGLQSRISGWTSKLPSKDDLKARFGMKKTDDPTTKKDDGNEKKGEGETTTSRSWQFWKTKGTTDTSKDEKKEGEPTTGSNCCQFWKQLLPKGTTEEGKEGEEVKKNAEVKAEVVIPSSDPTIIYTNIDNYKSSPAVVSSPA